MKKILITGENSYIGKSFIKWMTKYPSGYHIDTIGLRDDKWKERDFGEYDAIIHTVGIAHVDSNPSPKLESHYYKINRDLAIETAVKAKTDGVKQFIFLSSIIVYGNNEDIKLPKVINKNTRPNPTNFYGLSKLQAEEGLREIESLDFKVSIIRPPMIYGKKSKGNYQKLSKLSTITPLFLDVKNKRSMLYIDNLCEFLRLIIKNEEQGTFFPQNREYVETSELVRIISEVHNKKIKFTNLFNPILFNLGRQSVILNKVFGSIYYEKEISLYKEDYQIFDLKTSIKETEL